MTRLNNFIKHSGFTGEKQLSTYTLNLSVPSVTASSSAVTRTYTANIDIGEGDTIADVYMTVSNSKINFTTWGQYFQYTGEDSNNTHWITFHCYRASARRYTLKATLFVGYRGKSEATTVSAKIHTSASPFVRV